MSAVCREADASAQGMGRAGENPLLPASSPVTALGLSQVTVKFMMSRPFKGPNVISLNS